MSDAAAVTGTSVDRPVLVLERDGDGQACLRVRLPPPHGPGDPGPFALAGRHAFRVVAAADSLSGEALPGMIGTIAVEENSVRFVPHVPFERGVRYRATLEALGRDRPPAPPSLTLHFTLKPDEFEPAPTVTAIFPGAPHLPENVLRFYVAFSRPMRRGAARAAVRLLDERGDEVPDALYRAPAELWDPDMRVLTVLLDPGRLKRGVGPNRALGPPLVAGRGYCLEIDAAMAAIDGQRLAGQATKRFRTTAACRARVATGQWSLRAPRAGGQAALAVAFPQPMDQALLAGGLGVVGPDGRPVAGCAAVDAHGTAWRFAPSSPWTRGPHRLTVGPDVEDVCGNGLSSAFERPVCASGPRAPDLEDRSVSFAVT